MSMSDCVKCWDTPCECGWDYRKRSKLSRLNLAAVILGVPIDELILSIDSKVPDIHPLAEATDDFMGLTILTKEDIKCLKKI